MQPLVLSSFAPADPTLPKLRKNGFLPLFKTIAYKVGWAISSLTNPQFEEDITVFDGWTNIKRKPLFNLGVSASGVVFFSALDYSLLQE